MQIASRTASQTLKQSVVAFNSDWIVRFVRNYADRVDDTTTTSLEEVEGGDKYKDIMGDEVSSPTMMGDDSDSLGLEKFSLEDRPKGTPKAKPLDKINTDVKSGKSGGKADAAADEDDDEVQIMVSPVSADDDESSKSPKRPRTRSTTPERRAEIMDSPVSEVASPTEKGSDEDVLVASPVSDRG